MVTRLFDNEGHVRFILLTVGIGDVFMTVAHNGNPEHIYPEVVTETEQAGPTTWREEYAQDCHIEN